MPMPNKFLLNSKTKRSSFRFVCAPVFNFQRLNDTQSIVNVYSISSLTAEGRKMTTEKASRGQKVSHWKPHLTQAEEESTANNATCLEVRRQGVLASHR